MKIIKIQKDEADEREEMSGGQAKTKKEGEQEEKESATLAAAVLLLWSTQLRKKGACTARRNVFGCLLSAVLQRALQKA